MTFSENQIRNYLNLLAILIEIHQWEDCQMEELHTVSGQALYFKIASSLLTDSKGKLQPLKLLNGRITDRAMRTRIREFQELGLVDVVDSEIDARTKGVVSTDLFLKHLDDHLKLFKQLCDERYLMVEKF